MTLPHIPETPENLEKALETMIAASDAVGNGDIIVPDSAVKTFYEALDRHAQEFQSLYFDQGHIPESEKRQKEPGMGVSVDAKVRTYTSDCPLCEWKSRNFKKKSLASMAYLKHRQEHGMGGF